MSITLFSEILVFIFGTIIGSFLNVIIYRFNTGKSLNGRSMCMSCGRNLRWFELIPVFSWLMQKGKCVRCRSVIPYQYPAVEFITGLVFLGIVYKYLVFLNFSTTLFLLHVIPMMFLFSLLIVISVYDLRHKVIPNKLVHLFILLSFLSLFISPFGIMVPKIIDLFSGIIIALPFFLLWYFSRGTAMGLGDVKLMAGIGFLLGLWNGIAAVILAFWIGTVAALFLLVFHRKHITMRTQVPFGPFLALAAFIVFLFSISFFDIAQWLKF